MADKTTKMLRKYHEKNLKLLKELRKEGREMRRIDKLRAMSTEDVAKMILDSDCLYDDYCKSDCGIDDEDIADNDCLGCVVKWLEEEEGENEEK